MPRPMISAPVRPPLKVPPAMVPLSLVTGPLKTPPVMVPPLLITGPLKVPAMMLPQVALYTVPSKVPPVRLPLLFMLPRITPSVTLKGVLLEAMHTASPPVVLPALQSLMVPPVMVKLALPPDIYTPAPAVRVRLDFSLVVQPRMLPPVMRKTE